MMFCVDARHDEPCPQPCSACATEGCEPPVTIEEAMREFPDLDWADAVKGIETTLHTRFPHS